MSETLGVLRGFDVFYTIGVSAAFILGYTIRGIVERFRKTKDNLHTQAKGEPE